MLLDESGKKGLQPRTTGTNKRRMVADLLSIIPEALWVFAQVVHVFKLLKQQQP